MLSDEDKQWIKGIIEGRMDASEEFMKDYIGHAIEGMETKLIAEFWKWGQTADIRYRQDHTVLGHVDQRLVVLEDRITALERKEKSQ